jgi:tetratricopeptide (TPR) repeat protein
VVTLTSTPAELGRLLRCVGQIEHAWALHKEAQDASLRRAPFLLRAIESQLAMDAFAAGKVEEGRRWLRSVYDRTPCGEIGTAWHVLADPASASVREAEWTGDWDLAAERVEQALSEAKRRSLSFYEPILYYERGRCLEGLENLGEAEDSYREALAIAKANGLRPVQWQAHAGLARLYAAGGSVARADAERAAASRIVRQIADSLIEPGQRDSLLSTPPVQAVVRAG